MDNYLDRHHAELVARNNMLNSLYHKTPTELLGTKIPSKLPPADPFQRSEKRNVDRGAVERERLAWEAEARAFEQQTKARSRYEQQKKGRSFEY